MAQPVRFEDSRTLAASPEALWPLVADTERLNRASGLPEVHYSPTARPEGGSATVGEYRLGPLTLVRWFEEPFQFEAPRFYDVERRYHWGPIASLRAGMQLTAAEDGGTTVRAWGDFEPRGPLGWLAVRIIGPAWVRRSVHHLETFGRYLAGEIESAFPSLQQGTPEDEAAESTVRRTSEAPWDTLHAAGVVPELIARLRKHLQHSPDLDVLNMRPLLLAETWHADRLEVLSLFLHAAQAGIVVLHWDVLCPHCRTAKATYSALALLKPGAYCSSCATTYEAEFDRNVELRFDVAPAVRHARAAAYCEGSPMNTPHRIARRTVAPNSIAALQGDLGSGRYQVVSRQSIGSVTVDSGPQRATSMATRVVSVYSDRMGPDALGLPPGPLSLSIVSHLSVPATVDVERADWPDTIATAALVSTLGTFRDLFSTDVLAAGQQVAIGRLAFMAVAVVDPAALYATLGQGRAFKLVESCLRSAHAIIGAHHGATSGTLGETIVATFSDASDAVGAALMLQRSVSAMVGDSGVDTARLLHIGVHEGPCLAATVADRLGYFGTTPTATLNVLAAARGGEILVSEDVMADPHIAARLADEDVVLEPAELSLADGPLRVQRMYTSARRPTLLVPKAA